MERRARAARDLDHLPDRLENAAALVADVRHDRRAELGRDLGDGDELVRVRVRAGEVDEPERQHARAGLEREAHLAAHLVEPRRHALAADHEVPHRAVPDRRHERHRRPRRVERVEVLGEARPRPLRRPLPFERAQVRAPRAPVGNRRGCEAVGADHLRRESLQDLRREQRIVERRERGVRVQVDEARAEHRAALRRARRRRARRRSRRSARRRRRRPCGTTGRRPGRPLHRERRALQQWRAGRRRRRGSDRSRSRMRRKRGRRRRRRARTARPSGLPVRAAEPTRRTPDPPGARC